MNSEIPQKRGIENKEQPEQNNLEVPQGADEIQAEITQEIERSTADFEKQNENISTIETSLELGDPQRIESIKDELKLDSNIEELDTQAKILKQETERKIEWVQQDNPQWNENNFYRVIDENGYADYLEKNMVRSPIEGTRSKIVKGTNIDIGGRTTPFPSFAKGEPNLDHYGKQGENNYILESEMAMYTRGEKNPVTGHTIRDKHGAAYRPIDSTTGKTIAELSSKHIKDIYQKDTQGNLLKQKIKEDKN